ncbi:MAG: hypothetical protein U9P00_09265, partial [Pseudomonadota bacterium]|nr:hypothetical protein [Pseudomonadota bacterium]
VVNKATNHSIGRHSYGSFREVAHFYLGMQLPLLGVVGEDKHMHPVPHEQQALVNGNPQAAAARNIGSLADQLLVENAVLPERDMQSFCNRYLKAVEVKDAGQIAAAYVLEIPVNRKQKLQQQLESLSRRVDELIEEIERLRTDGTKSAALLQAPGATQHTEPEPLTETSIAALATDSETVTLQGETLSIYSMQKSNADSQYFAWHSLDDDLGTPEPEPQTD